MLCANCGQSLSASCDICPKCGSSGAPRREKRKLRFGKAGKCTQRRLRRGKLPSGAFVQMTVDKQTIRLEISHAEYLRACGLTKRGRFITLLLDEKGDRVPQTPIYIGDSHLKARQMFGLLKMLVLADNAKSKRQRKAYNYRADHYRKLCYPELSL